jgi:hypothetical protein
MEPLVRSRVVDASGWRWRASWLGIEMAAWNDIDGVAVVADIGPWDEWVGLAGHPPDPGPDEAMAWALNVLGDWLADPEHAARIAARER